MGPVVEETCYDMGTLEDRRFTFGWLAYLAISY